MTWPGGEAWVQHRINMFNYRKLIYKIIVNRGGYRITYYIYIYGEYIYSVVSYKISYSVATSIYVDFIY